MKITLFLSLKYEKKKSYNKTIAVDFTDVLSLHQLARLFRSISIPPHLMHVVIIIHIV